MKTTPTDRNELTDYEIQLMRSPRYMEEWRKKQRRELRTVTLVLVCFAAAALGLGYHLLTR